MDDKETWRAQMYKGLAELALLSILRQGPKYGLELLMALRDQASMEVAEGSIYPLLHRLEKAGWIKAEWRHDEGASHPRKYYLLSDEGHVTCQLMADEFAKLSTGLNRVIGNSHD